MESTKVKHFLVGKETSDGVDGQAWFSNVQDLHSAKVADAELGVAQLIADRSQEAFAEIERLREKNADLSRLLKPVVLTEGKTDAVVLNAAWQKLYPQTEMPFEIKSCDLGGAEGAMENAGADELKKILESTTKDQSPIRLGVFDRDQKGDECFNNLKKHYPVDSIADANINKNNLSAAIRLPENKWGSPFDDYLKGMTCIEMLFPFRSLPKDAVEFEFFIAGKKLDRARGEKWVQNLSQSPDLFDDVAFRVVPKFREKSKLSARLSKLDAKSFSNFKQVIESLRSVLKIMDV